MLIILKLVMYPLVGLILGGVAGVLLVGKISSRRPQWMKWQLAIAVLILAGIFVLSMSEFGRRHLVVFPIELPTTE